MTTVPVTSFYGDRILKKTKKHNFHEGVDTSNGKKYKHSAFGDGVVVESPQDKKHRVFGWYIRIEHAAGIETSHHSLDGHALFKVGETVKMGDIIGRAGKSALQATGNHVHNGLWINGEHVNPLDHLTPGEIVTVTSGPKGLAAKASLAAPLIIPTGDAMFIAIRKGSFFLAIPRAGAITLVPLGQNDQTENIPVVRFVSDMAWNAFLVCVSNPGIVK